MQFVKDLVKKFVFRHTNLGAPKYSYCIEPIELVTIINEIERLRGVKGAIVEIGVARGLTTRFIVEHILQSGYKDQKFYAIDTFNSFVKEHVEYEVSARNKPAGAIEGFGYNDYGVWAKNFAEFPFLKAIQADCAKFDYSSLGPLKVVFLDVDLYIPTKEALPKLYENLVSGGAILVDDVQNNNRWDGAYQAYMEFCQERGIQPEVVGKRCGIVRKP